MLHTIIKGLQFVTSLLRIVHALEEWVNSGIVLSYIAVLLDMVLDSYSSVYCFHTPEIIRNCKTSVFIQ